MLNKSRLAEKQPIAHHEMNKTKKALGPCPRIELSHEQEGGRRSEGLDLETTAPREARQ